MPRTADLAAVRKILVTDRPWAVYALADLEPKCSGPAEWHIAAGGQPALLLIYRGFEVPVLFAQGDVAALAPLLSEINAERALYLSVLPEAACLLRDMGYRIEEKKMCRMLADPRRFAPRPHTAVRLGPDDYAGLVSLYRDGDAAGEAPPFFDARMLRHGAYYGIREGGSLVAAAGTHVIARRDSVAGIGNVYTRRDRRGRGLGAQVAGAVTGELLRLGLRTVVLNVAENNVPAVRVYDRLGFRRYREYCEGMATI